jgi:predicted Fe-Mo cluster-binding NifX family protein
MKYAIPIHNSRLTIHFGEATEFILIETEAGRITSKNIVKTTAHNCSGTPRMLVERGVNIVMAGGMGLLPLLIFDQSGIEVILGIVETNPEKAVLAHLNQTLVQGQDVCKERRWPTVKLEHH